MIIFLNFSRPHCVIGSFGEKRGMLPKIAVENFNVGLMLGWDVRGVSGRPRIAQVANL